LRAADLTAALRGAADFGRLAALADFARLLVAADFAEVLAADFGADFAGALAAALRGLAATGVRLVVDFSLVFKVGALGRNGEAAAGTV
jgi:hypothetical protein